MNYFENHDFPIFLVVVNIGRSNNDLLFHVQLIQKILNGLFFEGAAMLSCLAPLQLVAHFPDGSTEVCWENDLCNSALGGEFDSFYMELISDNISIYTYLNYLLSGLRQLNSAIDVEFVII